MHTQIGDTTIDIADTKEEFCEICGNIVTGPLTLIHPCILAEACDECDLLGECDESCPAYEYSVAYIIEGAK